MRRSLLPLNALRVFDAASRTLSFTRAADELAVTPAAVGQQIRALEETLGVILFRRTAKGLELTPEAESALPALRSGFLSLEETISALQAGQSSFRLTVAVARPALRHWFMPRFLPWLDAHPEAVVHLLPLDQPVDFREANLDLALSFGPAPDAEGVFGKAIADEQWVTVAAPGGADRQIGWMGDGVQGDVPGRLSVADCGEAMEMAMSGIGIARIPATIAGKAIADGRLVEIAPRETSDLAFWLCAPAPQWRSPKVRALVETLLS